MTKQRHPRQAVADQLSLVDASPLSVEHFRLEVTFWAGGLIEIPPFADDGLTVGDFEA